MQLVSVREGFATVAGWGSAYSAVLTLFKHTLPRADAAPVGAAPDEQQVSSFQRRDAPPGLTVQGQGKAGQHARTAAGTRVHARSPVRGCGRCGRWA